MNYLLHTGLLLTAFYLYYRFFLRSETHFGVNRLVLLMCLTASFVLPLITVPAQWSLRSAWGVELENVSPVAMGEESPTSTVALPINTPVEAGGQETSRAEYSGESATTTTGGPIDLPDEEAIAPPTTSVFWTTIQDLEWLRLAQWVYWLGVGVFGLHFLFQLLLLFARMWRNPGYDVGIFRIVEVKADIAPYSFWNRIFINPDRYDELTFQQIIEHEAIHIRQRHSFDLVLAEALVILQWWNPFAWKYRSAVEHNLEYLTDAEMLNGGANPQHYQLNLLKVAVPTFSPGLTLSYNQSFLEKRIDMMKTKKSSTRTAWKYLAILPLMLLLVLQLNSVTAQRPAEKEQPIPARPEVAVELEANPSPALGETALSLSPTVVAVPSPRVDVAAHVNTAISSTVKASPMMVATPTPSVATTIAATSYSRMEWLKGAKRSWTATIEGNEVCIDFMYRTENNQHRSNHQECFTNLNLSSLPRNEIGTFTIKRPAGTMELRGQFTGNDGVGNFDFMPDNAFFSALAREGLDGYDEFEKAIFFYADMEADFPAFLKKKGYAVGKQKLLELAVFGYNEKVYNGTIAELSDMGYNDLSLQDLIEAKIFNLTPEYARELTVAGFPQPSFQKLRDAKIHGLSGAFVQELAKMGYKDLDLSTVMEMAIHGIDADYVKDLASVGFDAPPARELISAKIHGVSADAVKDLASVGIEGLDLNRMAELTIHGIDADYVRYLKEAGFPNLSLNDIQSAKIHNIDPEMAKSFASMGMDVSSFEDIMTMSIHGVTPAYVRGMRAAGYDDLDWDDYVGAKIHGISPEYAESFKAVGLESIPFDDLMSMKIHGVTPGFIKRNQDRERTPQEYIDLKIHGRN